MTDRAPEPREVEAGAAALRERYGRLGILSRVVVYNQPSAEEIAQTVLDAARGRFREEVGMSEALAIARVEDELVRERRRLNEEAIARQLACERAETAEAEIERLRQSRDDTVRYRDVLEVLGRTGASTETIRAMQLLDRFGAVRTEEK